MYIFIDSVDGTYPTKKKTFFYIALKTKHINIEMSKNICIEHHPISTIVVNSHISDDSIPLLYWFLHTFKHKISIR